jgi:SAM-dependent methyltransferase
LPGKACREIALKLVQLAGLRTGDLLLEIGAGTGEIGLEIARLHADYIGLDLSLPMLREFHRRVKQISAPPALLAADANASWPIADRCVQVVFGSRSFHLLSVQQLIQEALRVRGAGGAMLVVGWVSRDPQSVKAMMRQEMRRLLGASVAGSVSGANQTRILVEALVEGGGVALAPLVASRWTTTHSPAESLNSWRSKDGLGGISVPEPIKAEILSKLESWAGEVFQNLKTAFPCAEQYVLQGVQLPAA